jgi:chemotaxis protein CheD
MNARPDKAVAGQPTLKVLPGGYHADHREVVLVTTLGSCVSACLHDAGVGIGGMNHFMLPDGGSDHSGSARYGVHAMELLINALLQMGARRGKLVAKVFGGAAVIRHMTASDVGKRNIQFVEDFLRLERIPVTARDLGGSHPRKVAFHTQSGRAFVKALPIQSTDPLLAEEARYRTELVRAPVSSGTVELF